MNVAALNSSESKPVPADKVRDRTEQWLSQTFFGQVLKQMRESPFRSELFEGGKGGRAYQSLFDQQLADRMSKSIGRSFVDVFVRQISPQSQILKAPLPAMTYEPVDLTA
jgi:Rod binding domain-containing protein